MDSSVCSGYSDKSGGNLWQDLAQAGIKGFFSRLPEEKCSCPELERGFMVAVALVCRANVFSKACVFDLVATEACVERGQRFPKTYAGNFTCLFICLFLVDKLASSNCQTPNFFIF